MSWPFITHCALIFTSLLYILHASFYLNTAVIFDMLILSPNNSGLQSVSTSLLFSSYGAFDYSCIFALSYDFSSLFCQILV